MVIYESVLDVYYLVLVCVQGPDFGGKANNAPQLCYGVILIVHVLAFSSAFAERSRAADDYVSCLIGRATVALHAQGAAKDAERARVVAYKQCKMKGTLGDEGAEGLSDYVNMMIEKMAK